MYAGLSLLGDSILSCRYAPEKNNLLIAPAGDPTVLHPDFIQQPLFDLMRRPFDSIIICLPEQELPGYGTGWAWDDFDLDYQAENTRMPVFGNSLWLNQQPALYQKRESAIRADSVIRLGNQRFRVSPTFFSGQIRIIPEPRKLRERLENIFYADGSGKPEIIPFITNRMQTTAAILSDLLDKPVIVTTRKMKEGMPLYSVPADSLFAPMMQHSDNFFAEQILLMAAEKKLGKMDVRELIDSLLADAFRDIPDRPEWVDGSGLSRYNLFTPRSMVYLLGKLRSEFGLSRLKNILPSGGTGTLKHYYLPMKEKIYAKTGSVSSHFCLSGYLYTQSNKLLYFSVMTGSFPGKLSAARRAVERFVSALSASN
jgi:D-alanyl-D-alanine carboxypeptidase/D-alanyl-D-alanine-endopeptidase (penicillin-binding protein 4)